MKNVPRSITFYFGCVTDIVSGPGGHDCEVTWGVKWGSWFWGRRKLVRIERSR